MEKTDIWQFINWQSPFIVQLSKKSRFIQYKLNSNKNLIRVTLWCLLFNLSLQFKGWRRLSWGLASWLEAMNGILCLPSTESLKKVLGYLTAGYLFFQASQKDQGLSSAEEPMFLCLVGTLSREFSERGWGVNATNSAPFRQGLSH